MPDCVDRETFDDESDSFVTGGKMNVSRNMSFFDYISTTTPNEKAQLLNLLQYGGLTVLPIMIVLKLMKMYVPSEDPFKSSTEILVEVIVQLAIIIVAFFIIHKLVLYLPTYSNMEYDKFSLLSGILPLFFLMFTLDTKISEKITILFDRLLFAIGLKKEPFDEEETSEEGKNGARVGGGTTTNTVSQSGSGSGMIEDRLIGGFPTQREVNPTITHSMMPQGGMGGGEMMGVEEPFAANSVLGGSTF